MGEHDTADTGLMVAVASSCTEGIFRKRMLCSAAAVHSSQLQLLGVPPQAVQAQPSACSLKYIENPFSPCLQGPRVTQDCSNVQLRDVQEFHGLKPCRPHGPAVSRSGSSS